MKQLPWKSVLRLLEPFIGLVAVLVIFALSPVRDVMFTGGSWNLILLQSVIVALGAEIAGTDSPTKIAEQIVGLTQDGEKCTNFADCKKLIADGVDIDYDGISGPLEFVDAGEPSEASILILEFDADGALQVVGSVNGKI